MSPPFCCGLKAAAHSSRLVTTCAIRGNGARAAAQHAKRREHQRRTDTAPAPRLARGIHPAAWLRAKHRCSHSRTDEPEQHHACNPRTLFRERTRTLIEHCQVMLQAILGALHAALGFA